MKKKTKHLTTHHHYLAVSKDLHRARKAAHKPRRDLYGALLVIGWIAGAGLVAFMFAATTHL